MRGANLHLRTRLHGMVLNEARDTSSRAWCLVKHRDKFALYNPQVRGAFGRHLCFHRVYTFRILKDGWHLVEQRVNSFYQSEHKKRSVLPLILRKRSNASNFLLKRIKQKQV
jgi:hypothetical protein